MGPKRGSLGTSFVSVDWLVKVFWSYGLVYIPSDQIYIHTTPVSGCMYRHSRYIPFYSQSWLACRRKSCALPASPGELSPYDIPRRGPPGTWTFSYGWTAWVVPQTKRLSSKNWEAYNLSVSSTLVTRFQRTQQLWNTGWAGFLNSPGDFCWLDLPRWANTVLQG